LGAAILYNPYRVQGVRPDGTVYTFGLDDVKFGVETGGGVRYFVREDWGIRGEYRYTVSTQNFSRIVLGIFYRLPSTWP
jgi:hypothetical protein